MTDTDTRTDEQKAADQTAADRDPNVAGHVPSLTPDELRAQADAGAFRPDGRPAADVYYDDRLAAERVAYDKQRMANQKAAADAEVRLAEADLERAQARLEETRRRREEAHAAITAAEKDAAENVQDDPTDKKDVKTEPKPAARK